MYEWVWWTNKNVEFGTLRIYIGSKNHCLVLLYRLTKNRSSALPVDDYQLFLAWFGLYGHGQYVVSIGRRYIQQSSCHIGHSAWAIWELSHLTCRWCERITGPCDFIQLDLWLIFLGFLKYLCKYAKN